MPKYFLHTNTCKLETLMKFEQKKEQNFKEGTLGFEPATPGLQDQCAHRYTTVVELPTN